MEVIISMKAVTFCLLSITGVLTLASAGLSAQTVVGETAGGDLMVVDYKGKPPYKRRIVSADNSAEFARFEALQDTVLVTTSAGRRSGPPGKSLPLQQARVERVPEADISQFARFEETGAAGSTRMWRGAPGKGRPRLGR